MTAPQPHDLARERLRRRHALLALTACATLALLWAGCASDGLEGTGALGTVRFAVRWPGASARVIPAATTRIAVSVSGEGIGPAISGEILATEVSGDWGELELAVPPGNARLIEAEARDGANTVLARGSRTVDVPAGVTTNAVIELVQNLFSGTVADLHDDTAEAAVTVTVQGQSDDTDVVGRYEFSGLTSATARMVVSGGSIITRSFPVAVGPLGEQDVTSLASDYNTTFLRAQWFTTNQILRWPTSTPPTFIAYRKKLGTGAPGTDVDAADWAAIVDVLENELPIFSEGFYGGPARVEYFNGRPEEDSRFVVDGDWGYSTVGSNAICVAVRDSFSGGYAGLGGCAWYGTFALARGGAVTISGGGGYADKRHVVRHEVGHALGLAHPFSNLNSGSPLMRDSVMNYQAYGHWSSDYSEADRETMRFAMHRPQGNASPDTDPDAFVGYKGTGPETGIVSIDTPTGPIDIRFVIREGERIWLDDPSPLGLVR